MIALHLKAINDVNGNPRRLFVVLDSVGIQDVVDENYDGEAAIRIAGWDGVDVIASINVQATEYRRWLKIGRELREGNGR